MSECCQGGVRCSPEDLREALSIHTRKITDSCRDKDCIEDLRVYLTRGSQALLDTATGAKVRCAELLLARCNGRVEKVRYIVPYEGYTWEVDIFEGDNEGLALAEVELSATEEQPSLPKWIWKEVTSDYHYRNSYLAQRPYKSWFK